MVVVKDYPLKRLIRKYKDEKIEKLLAAYRALLQRYKIAEAVCFFSLMEIHTIKRITGEKALYWSAYFKYYTKNAIVLIFFRNTIYMD